MQAFTHAMIQHMGIVTNPITITPYTPKNNIAFKTQRISSHTFDVGAAAVDTVASGIGARTVVEHK